MYFRIALEPGDGQQRSSGLAAIHLLILLPDQLQVLLLIITDHWNEARRVKGMPAAFVGRTTAGTIDQLEG